MKRMPRPIIPALTLLLLCIAGSGDLQAVQRSTDDSGQVLLFPVIAQGLRYDTLFSLTNRDTVRPTLFRMTVRDGKDGQSKARVNVFLGAGDTFAAAVDGASMTPADETCYASNPAPAADGGIPLNLERSAFLEVIEMGTVTPGTATADLINEPDGNCEAVIQAVVDRAALGKLDAPGGALAGGLTLIDVPLGLSFSISPIVLERFRATAMYESVTSSHPNLNDAEPPESVVTGDFRPGGESSTTLRSTWSQPVDAVSAVLMAATLNTDFSVESSIAAATDVALTFPTRHHYWTEGGEAEREPFVTRYVRGVHNTDQIETPGQQFLLVARNREGDTVIDAFRAKCTPVIINPYPGPLLTASQLNLRVGAEAVMPGMAIHEAVQVSESDICGSIHGTPVRELMDSGIIDMDFGSFSMTSLEGHVHHGLPVIGASLTAIANETTTLANYGISSSMRRSLDIAYPVSESGPDSKHLSSDLERTAPGRTDVSADGSLVVLETDMQLAPDDPEGGDLEKIGHNDVYLFRQGEATPELLTPTQSQFPEDVRTFDLSEDGKTLAYTLCEWVPDGPDTGHCNPRLRTRSIVTGEISAISPTTGEIDTSQKPLVANGGAEVVYVVDEGLTIRLYLFDANDATSSSLVTDVKWLFDMTPNGSQVLFSRGPRTFSGEPDQLLLVDTATGDEHSALPPDLAARLDAPSDHLRIEDAAISASGRYVAFESTGEVYGVFWYDRESDELKRVAPGRNFNRTTRGLDLRGDGGTVALATEDRLVPGVPPDSRQVYLWRTDASLEVVSTGPLGMSGNGDSWNVAMSGNGETFAYGTGAENIVNASGLPDDPFLMQFHFIRADLSMPENSR